MRALVLLLVCVMILAAIQASYLVVEARHRKEFRLEDDGHHDQKDHHKKHADKHNDKSIATTESHHSSKSNSHKEKHVSMETATQNYSQEMPRNHKSDHPGHHHKYHIERVDISPANQSTIQHIDIQLHVPEKLDPVKPGVVKSTETGHRFHDYKGKKLDRETLRKNNEAAEISIYDQMMKDEPDMRHWDKGNNFKNKEGKGRKGKKSGKKAGWHSRGKGNIPCEGQQDCAINSCCTQTKKGRKLCRPAGLRVEGQRCSSNCVCRFGLKCFMKEHKKVHHQFGHCVDPAANKHKGIYATDEPVHQGQQELPSGGH